jgi:hypothetical protein
MNEFLLAALYRFTALYRYDISGVYQTPILTRNRMIAPCKIAGFNREADSLQNLKNKSNVAAQYAFYRCTHSIK